MYLYLDPTFFNMMIHHHEQIIRPGGKSLKPTSLVYILSQSCNLLISNIGVILGIQLPRNYLLSCAVFFLQHAVRAAKTGDEHVRRIQAAASAVETSPLVFFSHLCQFAL